jgi:CheY-like chemotaxis protein
MSITLQLAPKKPMRLARVLLADDDPTARLTLQTVLEAGGYKVDSAASAAEAMQKLDAQEYSLVLTGRDMGAPDSGRRIVEHAKTIDYRPATAFFNTESDEVAGSNVDRKPVLVAPEDIPELLGMVADLISRRASMQVRREMRIDG